MINLQEQIELGIKALLKRVDYAYNAPVRAWRDGSQAVTYPIIVVQAQIPEYGAIPELLWDVIVTVMAITYTADDEDQSQLNAIHDEAYRQMLTVTSAQLQAECTDVIIHGIFQEGGAADVDESTQRKAVDFRVMCEASAIDPTTTSTTTTT